MVSNGPKVQTDRGSSYFATSPNRHLSHHVGLCREERKGEEETEGCQEKAFECILSLAPTAIGLMGKTSYSPRRESPK